MSYFDVGRSMLFRPVVNTVRATRTRCRDSDLWTRASAVSYQCYPGDSTGHVTDRCRPVDGRAVIKVEMPRSMALSSTRRHRSVDSQPRDVTNSPVSYRTGSPVSLRVVIGRKPEVQHLSHIIHHSLVLAGKLFVL